MRNTALVTLILVILFIVIASVGCGSGTHEPPSVEELQRNIRVVDFRLPDGRSLTCLYYGAKGSEPYKGYSWLVLDCDWSSIRR